MQQQLPPPLPPEQRKQLAAECLKLRRESHPDYVRLRTELATSMVRMVYGLAGSLAPHCPEPDALHALASEGTLAVIQAIDTWEPSKGRNLVAWCRFKAFRAMLDFLESWCGISNHPLDERDLEDDDSDPADWAVRGEEAERMRAALLRLPDRFRTVLHWRFFEDWSYSQIGAELGVSMQRAEQILNEALQELRNIL